MPKLNIFSFQSLYPIKIVRARKQYIWDSTGKKYVDFNTGNGIGFLGHGNPYVIRKIKEALSSVYMLPVAFSSPIKEEALDALSKIAPKGLDSVAMLNTGSEAVELSLKLVYKYKGKNSKVIFFSNSFHGRTLGALSITSSNPHYGKDFPLVDKVEMLPYNDISAIESRPFSDVGGVILEVIQGEGGIIPAEEEFLKALYEKCRSNDVPLIIDEIQSGFGRTGKLWAFMHYPVEPDIVIGGKSMGGGVPVSVVFAREEIAKKLQAYEHGSTFGFNPLAAAGITGAVDAYFKMNVEEKARSMGDFLKNSLSYLAREHGWSVRGKGLMIGIQHNLPLSSVSGCMLNKGVVVSKAGMNVTRLLPPFLITQRDISFFIETFYQCWEEIYAERYITKAITGPTKDPISIEIRTNGS